MSTPFAPHPAAKPTVTPPFCPSCGAGTSPDQTKCWLCYAPLDEPPPALPAVVIDERVAAANPSQFSIETILLVTTLAAVLLGLFRYSPGLAVMLIIFSVPALVRTVFVGRREKRRGQRVTAGGKIGHFLLSLVIMYAVWVAASTAFFIAAIGTCFAAIAASSASEEMAVGVGIAGLIVSAVVGLFVAGLLLRATWPKRN
ncbi:MAG TPA: hypothetical protein VMP01_26075 [Pirellulaceae bacterium]|nr:hypothetical protein [Pirellulaceae bacterium]